MAGSNAAIWLMVFSQSAAGIARHLPFFSRQLTAP
jgi:hypothetical protein